MAWDDDLNKLNSAVLETFAAAWQYKPKGASDYVTIRAVLDSPGLDTDGGGQSTNGFEGVDYILLVRLSDLAAEPRQDDRARRGGETFKVTTSARDGGGMMKLGLVKVAS